LTYHNTYAIKRHVKVRGEKSPYDGDSVYWSQRLKNDGIGFMSKNAQVLNRRQKDCCALCGLHFEHDDVMKIDHITPRALGGKNLQSH
jgi:RNA-directed DNA polymerase